MNDSVKTRPPLRALMNNLDPEVAERPQELVVYGGIGKAARNWQCFEQIVAALKALGDDETLLIQSGSRSAYSRRTQTPRACCSPTPTSWRAGRTGITSTSSIARGS